jgi:hypothetical protein
VETTERVTRFDACLRNMRTLLVGMPTIYQALGEKNSIERRIPRWSAMKSRVDAYDNRDGGPALVAVLFGPSGSGKSTLFRLLTSLDVPAGGHVRPLTCASMAAVPMGAHRADGPGRLFTCYDRVEPVRLPEDSAKLRDQSSALTTLYYADYEGITARDLLPVVLVDVPDFNTVEQTNWERAERMLARAELVVFVVYAEGYKDARIVSTLARCCSLAGSLAYVLTKSDRESAKAIWEDLLAHARQAWTAERRMGGQPLSEFLASSPCYFSPRSASPTLADVQALGPTSPSLVSILGGEGGEQMILTGLLQPAKQVLGACGAILRDSKALLRKRAQDIASAELVIKSAAERIAARAIRLTDVLRLLAEEAVAGNRPGAWRRYIGLRERACIGVARVLSFVWNRLVRLVGMAGHAARIDPSADESERLGPEIESAVQIWRDQFPEEARSNGILAVAKYRPILAGLPAVPRPGMEWEREVRQAARDWNTKNRFASLLVAAGPDVLVGLGVLFIVLQMGMSRQWIHVVLGPAVAVSGLGFGAAVHGNVLAFTLAGKVLVLKALGAAAGASLWGAVSLKILNTIGLQELLKRASHEWSEKRTMEIARHLQVKLLDPLFAPWRTQLAELQEAPLAECQRACDGLERMAQERPASSALEGIAP